MQVRDSLYFMKDSNCYLNCHLSASTDYLASDSHCRCSDSMNDCVSTPDYCCSGTDSIPTSCYYSFHSPAAKSAHSDNR